MSQPPDDRPHDDRRSGDRPAQGKPQGTPDLAPGPLPGRFPGPPPGQPGGWGSAPYGAPYQGGPQQPSHPQPGHPQPVHPQPGPYAPGPYASPYTPVTGGRSDSTMRWVGLLVGFFLGPTLLMTLWTVVSFFLDAVGYHEGVTGIGSLAVGVVFVAAMVAGLVFPQTRWWALGMIIGIAVTFIVLAGACLAFIYLLTTALEP